MSKVDGKNVKVVGDLTADDHEFGNQFDKTTAKVIVKYDDGRRAVVAKSAVTD